MSGGVGQAIYNLGRDTLSRISNSTRPANGESRRPIRGKGGPGGRSPKYRLTSSRASSRWKSPTTARLLLEGE